MLTDDNPSEQYGIDTIEAVARAVHRDLNAGRLVPRARLAANVAPAPCVAGSVAVGGGACAADPARHPAP